MGNIRKRDMVENLVNYKKETFPEAFLILIQ